MIRGLLRTTLGTVGACIITAGALTLIVALVAGYAGVLEAHPKEGSAHVDQ